MFDILIAHEYYKTIFHSYGFQATCMWSGSCVYLIMKMSILASPSSTWPLIHLQLGRFWAHSGRKRAQSSNKPKEADCQAWGLSAQQGFGGGWGGWGGL